MHWNPPHVKITPKLKTAYKLYNKIIKKNMITSKSGKVKNLQCDSEYKLQRVAKIISKEQLAFRQSETCVEQLILEMVHSIETSATKTRGC